ncbi:hypothetical protein RJT34_27572 [Clitoria ternatea]|uniref:Uncharacterized protein n=1 Tax=Clitoria ternatea TaxID=43366 RepID=A0AAN9F9Y2_CLITE
MATLFCVSNPIAPPLALASPGATPFPNFSSLRLAGGRRKARGSAVAARAGPSTTSIAFAIALPTSLLAVTVLASIRMADKLDQDWLEEVAKNEAFMEADEDDDDDDYDEDDYDNEDDDIETYEPALPQARNRPKREA